MRFGICTSLDNAAAAKSAGWDYIEESVQAIFQGLLPDDQWQGLARVRSSPLPVPACNLLVPGSLKITGPAADLSALRQYLERAISRAAKCGTTMLVFGSGGARQVPDGFDRIKAKQQIIAFARAAAEIGAKYGVTIVAEPLNRKECNIINSVAEAMEYMHAVEHANFQCLVDSYHFWVENESLDALRDAMPSIRHVHVADRDGRVAPGQTTTVDYGPFFRVLKDGGYDRMISVEALNFASDAYGRALEFVRSAWLRA
jgi:sugar phosphate isomerase/epimerase